ncbi:uroporphyrinogen-III synthase [Sphingopyxis sp. RIFCSPHIGHO2_12_FULL_65_19]|uniref:uroporphyrinogen-III synthase n=1 Tax=Sphingopyxis sp. RIFCSPHIGHO2_12_FULL_65_19 TaxID=1802172 RepID=UPI0008D35584|nr:uroporphyrinogen-III synthase [Sphingopyxis sp. RIFCSPHIGHO2_12_FULL_65_19]OHD07379.1 MAG: uroporphyrinogen-III synthase [Sphingopyxis sp. RIFCSPHIGHO2_12_FULL_65_19]
MTDGPPLIVTRPEPGNAATVQRARDMGFDARPAPLFASHAVDWTVPPVGDFDALLLTSAAAARLAGPGFACLAALPVYAVGAATARAAEMAGLTVAMTGTADARRLLDAMAAENIPNILWLCGRDRSEIGAPGVAITPLPCYAVDPVPPPPDWTETIAAPAVLLAHSARAATRISDLVGPARGHLSLVAISPAVAAAAGEGWRDLAIAGQPNDVAILAQARALWHKGAK